MGVVVVTPPVHDLDLDLVKAHLRVDHDDDDALIGAYVDAAVSAIDGPRGWLNRAVWPQTLRFTADTLCRPFRLPHGPVIAVDEIEYVASDGTATAWADDDWMVTADDRIVLKHGAVWPSLRGDADGVSVTYQAGFADVPKAIQSALLLMVGDLWMNRETAVVGTVSAEIKMSATVSELLAPYRIIQV
jgi:uncharacterized phiE125 gp8 family phage protein